MTDRQRYRMLHGPYTTPKVRIGRTVLVDEARGLEVVVVGLSDTRIPWPIGKPKYGRARSPVVCGNLEQAVRLESEVGRQGKACSQNRYSRSKPYRLPVRLTTFQATP
jgi:hypothetical protein